MVIKSECPLSPRSSLCAAAFQGLAVVTRHPGGQARLLLSLPAAPSELTARAAPSPPHNLHLRLPHSLSGPLCAFDCGSCPLSVIKSSSGSPRRHSGLFSHAALANRSSHSHWPTHISGCILSPLPDSCNTHLLNAADFFFLLLRSENKCFLKHVHACGWVHNKACGNYPRSFKPR